MTAVRTILALAASNNCPLHQMDIKNAFLHGDLKECIYMKSPLGLSSPSTLHVCKLYPSLYGLKQVLRAWFRTTLLQSFKQSKYDTSLFLRKSDMGLLLVYIDNIVISDSNSLYYLVSSKLSELFYMKDLGSLTYFLVLEVHYSPSGISLNQQKYANDLVATTGLQESTSVDTPMELNVKLRKEEGDLLADPSLYRKLVGSLVYLSITRPDISFAVQRVTFFRLLVIFIWLMSGESYDILRALLPVAYSFLQGGCGFCDMGVVNVCILDFLGSFSVLRVYEACFCFHMHDSFFFCLHENHKASKAKQEE